MTAGRSSRRPPAPPAGTAAAKSTADQAAADAKAKADAEQAAADAKAKADAEQAAAVYPPGAVSRLRFKASRPTFRRGGLVLNDRTWVEVGPGELAAANAVALLADPVVSIEGASDDGVWTALQGAERSALYTALRQLLAD
jgi:hypothetical protein